MTEMTNFTVELPGGGDMRLKSAAEVEVFERSSQRYQDDYALHKVNDLILLGAILTQGIIMFRSQQRLAEMTDDAKPGDLSSCQMVVADCAKEIRELEKSLGVDKKTRESGGQHTVANYVTELKKAAHQYGIRIAERVKEYDKVMMEARWKLRLLKNGDAEDRAYHDLTPEKVCEWLEQQLAEIEAKDKEWAKTKGKVFLGKL